VTGHIARRSERGGHVYEIVDFSEYARALEEKGIEPPPHEYRIFVSSEDEQLIRDTVSDWEAQIALFFRLGRAADINYQIVQS
jgi:hypothetical protein